MEAKVKTKMLEKIKSKEVCVGMNSTLRACKKGDILFIVYADNISDEMLGMLNKLELEKYPYEGDSEALAIACSKSFNISVLGVKK